MSVLDFFGCSVFLEHRRTGQTGIKTIFNHFRNTHARYEIVVRIVERPGYTRDHTGFILKNESLCVSDSVRVRVRVERMDSVPLIGFGKVPHFVSRIPTKYTQAHAELSEGPYE